MLLDLDELVTKWNLNITGVLHVGAHLGEEAATYAKHGIDRVWWVEGNPDIIPELERNVKPFGHKIVNALVSEKDDVLMPFNITNHKSMSSSLFEFGTHPQFSPDTVFVDQKLLPTRTIDSIVDEYEIEGCNLLNMDLQGAELLALRGAKKFLRDVDYILTEINVDEVYIRCAKVEELDAFLDRFKRVESYLVPGQGWGDALYCRTDR